MNRPQSRSKGTKGRSASGARGQKRSKPPVRSGHSRRGAQGNRNRGESRPGTATSKRDGLGGDHIEGRQAVRELLRAGTRRTQQVLISEDVYDTAVLAEIADLCEERRVPLQHFTRKKLDDYALTDSHQGVIAQAEPIQPVALETLISENPKKLPMIVALDGVTDPRNLGAVLRTAEVAGVTGIVLPRHRAARLTPAAVKAAAGAVEHLPIALVAGLPAAIKQMSDKGLWVIGLDESARTSIYDMRVATEPLTVVLGAEGEGISHLIKQRCDQLVAIPQTGQIGSLNVSNAAAITIYEIKRQREIS